MSPLPPERVFFLLALESVPAALSMLLGLGRGFGAKRKLLASASGPGEIGAMIATAEELAPSFVLSLLAGILAGILTTWATSGEVEQ